MYIVCYGNTYIAERAKLGNVDVQELFFENNWLSYGCLNNVSVM